MYPFIKRLIDIVGASLCLIVFAPLMLVTALMVRTTMGSPIVFRQIRPGLNQKPFTIYKFRTMRDTADCHGNPLCDAERLTKFGTFMRLWSIDELPQFVNILKGDMSFIGPRPLLFEFFPFYTPTEMRRHEVRPGVTGWAQVHGRNSVDWDKRLALDVWYVDHANLWLDITIILKTIRIVICREGVTTEGHATFLRLDDARRGKEITPMEELSQTRAS